MCHAHGRSWKASKNSRLETGLNGATERIRSDSYCGSCPISKIRATGPSTPAKEELDSLLQKSSTREHLLSDVPLGVWLSGGVDSSTILHYAAQVSTSRLKTFSISFRGRSFDESGYIRQVVDHYQTEHEELGPHARRRSCQRDRGVRLLLRRTHLPMRGALPVWFLPQNVQAPQLPLRSAAKVLMNYSAATLTYRANSSLARTAETSAVVGPAPRVSKLHQPLARLRRQEIQPRIQSF